MLGLKVDLTKAQECEMRVGHTPERKDELRQKIDSILADGYKEAKEAERLRGRMVFFEGYTFGRVASAAIKNLGRFCTGTEGKRKLDNSLKYSLNDVERSCAVGTANQYQFLHQPHMDHLH